MSERLRIIACSGVGALGDWEENEFLCTYIKNAAVYFLYTFIPEDEVNAYSQAVQEKRKKQLEVKKYVQDYFVPVYGTKADFDALIRQSIVIEFKNNKKLSDIDSPEEAIAYLRGNGEISGFGWTEAFILFSIIAMVLNMILTVVNYIHTQRLQNEAKDEYVKHKVPDEATILSAAAEAADWDESKQDNQENKGNGLLALAAIPALLAVFNQ